MSHYRALIVALSLALLALSVQVAGAATVQDVVNLATQTEYQHCLDDLLYTHLGDNKGMTGPQHDLARDSIRTYWSALGYQTSLDSHPATAQRPICVNVVAVKPGCVRPQEIYIVGAHYDSVNNPGADDNASAVAAIMVAAKALAAYNFEATITLIAFDAEEIDMGGSAGYAADHGSDNIRGMISLEMIAATSSRVLIAADQHRVIEDQFASAITLYGQGLTPILTSHDVHTDDRPFLTQGFDSCYVSEGGVNHNYHQPSDSVDTAGNIDYGYATKITRGAVGYLATQAGLMSLADTTAPDAVTNLAASPSSTIGGVDLAWTAPADHGPGGSGPFTCASYDLRYSTATITAGNWASASVVTGLPSPKAPGSAETFTLTGLTGGTTYYFALKSKDTSANVSTLSNVPSAVATAADTTAPDAVNNLAGTPSQTVGGVDLTWTAPADHGPGGSGPFTCTSYDLRYRTNAITASNWSTATLVTGLATPKSPGQAETFTVTGLTGGTTYYFAIKAKDPSGNTSTLSNVPSAVATAPDTTAPDAVTNLVASPSQTTGGVDLIWTAPADHGAQGTGPFTCASYDLRYSTAAITAGNWASATVVTGLPSPKTPGQAESCTVTSLTGGTTYYFALKSKDASANVSALSNVPSAVATVPPDTTAPDTVTNLAASPSQTTGGVDLIWTAPADHGAQGTGPFTCASYDLRYSTNPITAVNWGTATAVAGLAAPKPPAQAETFTVSGLTGGTTYYFALKATDASSNVSALSNVPTAIPTGPDATPPNTVTDLQAQATAAIGVVDLTWTAPTDYGWAGSGPFACVSYDLRYSTDPITAGNWGAATHVINEPAPKAPGQAESYTVSGLTGGVQYYFSLKATDANSNVSALSNVAAATPVGPDVTNPEAIGDLHAQTSATSGAVDLTWPAPADYGYNHSGPLPCASYDLRYSTSPITTANWGAAAKVSGEPAPKAPGQPESFTVSGLVPGTVYYFALKSKDTNNNLSDLSNVTLAAAGPPDPTSANWIGNLLGKPSKTSNGVDLTWTAPTDYGYNHSGPYAPVSYDLRYSTLPIRWDDADASWNAATPVTGLPVPKTPGSLETFTVSGLAAGQIYHFALKSTDISGNVSEVSNCAPARASMLGERVLQVGLNGYTGETDSYLMGNNNTAHNTQDRMIVAGFADQGVSQIRRGILRFDLTDIPTGVTITSATLSLYSFDASQTKGDSGFYGLYPISRSWTAAAVTWTHAAAGISWTVAGGEFAATPDATSPKQAVAAVWYPFDVTARVQDWLSNPSSNYGWIAKCTDENLHNQDRFYQADAAGTTYRPKLVISDMASPIPGDLDGDGKVNVRDVLVLGDSWGLTPSQRGYDPCCDLNSDGTVDLVDLATVAAKWPQ